MALITQKVFFDTNVCDLLSKPRNATARSTLEKRLLRSYRVMVSPATIFELLNGLARSDGRYFSKHQDRFRVLLGGGAVKCLPSPGAFVIGKVLGRPAPRPDFEPKDFAEWIKIIVAANSYDDLVNGKVKRAGRSVAYGMDFLILSTQMDEGKSGHAKLLLSVRDGTLNRPTAETWVAGILQINGYACSGEEARTVASRLNAAYLFDSALWDLARQDSYDFLRHASDWIDCQQLYYLADPSMHLLTDDDSTIKRRVAESAQASRILLLREEAEKLGVGIT